MSEEFKIEIVNPEKSFLSKEDVTQVIVPAFEGEMGILKDHIAMISFLKPGIIEIHSKSGDDKFFVEDGIVEFKNNSLSVLTSSIFNLKNVDKMKTSDSPTIKRFLGQDGNYGNTLGIDNNFMVSAIKSVGNYGEIYNRNVGPDTKVGLARGQNATWKEGGLMYSPPFR